MLFPISLRGDFRDFYTIANHEYGGGVSGNEQHNFVLSGGVIIHSEYVPPIR